MKNVKKIINQTVGKRFTYFNFRTKNGMNIQTEVSNLKIDSSSDTIIYVRGETAEWSEWLNIPMSEIDNIEEIEKENFDIQDAEAEYKIHYYDGSTLFIQIYNQID